VRLCVRVCVSMRVRDYMCTQPCVITNSVYIYTDKHHTQMDQMLQEIIFFACVFAGTCVELEVILKTVEKKKNRRRSPFPNLPQRYVMCVFVSMTERECMCVCVRVRPAHTLCLSHTHPLTRSVSHTHTRSHALSLTHTHTHTRSVSHTHTPAHTLFLSHTHTRSHTHTHTHTHPLTRSVSHTHASDIGRMCARYLL